MKIAIIGGGISGLRAALELAPAHKVIIFEKSAGVGGRIATRRFGNVPVNHGAPSFERRSAIYHDHISENFEAEFLFTGAATDLPKAIRDSFLNLGGEIRLNTKVASVQEKKLIMENGEEEVFDGVIITAPLPQVRELLKRDLLPDVRYTKELLLIGERNGVPVVERLPAGLTEELFELPEEEIRAKCGIEARDLSLKKWRYARVEKGVPAYYYAAAEKILIAGDAFDPHGHYDIASAWISGRLAGSVLA